MPWVAQSQHSAGKTLFIPGLVEFAPGSLVAMPAKD
jgi:hypothetical protein